MLDNSAYKYKTKFKNVRIGQTFVEYDQRYVKIAPPTGASHQGKHNARLVGDETTYETFDDNDTVYINNGPARYR